METYDTAVSLRQQGQFGDAINAFQTVIDAASAELAAENISDAGRSKALQELKANAEASIELIHRITGFVNKDLMNP